MESTSWPTDAELVDACREGRADAFRTLIERYQDRVYNAVYRMVELEEDARDIVQETFIKAYENLPRFRGDAALYTWLFRIAVNQTLTFRRKTKRLRLVQPLDEDPEVSLAGSQAERLVDPPEAALEQQDRERLLAEAMGALDPDHRAAIVLRDVEGLDYVTISDILDVPPGTVKSRIHRARLLLRERLRDMLD
jgi:RNA polymerase sigma-70 factor (ECF subfamily)